MYIYNVKLFVKCFLFLTFTFLVQQEVLTSQSESMIDLQFEPQAISVSATSDVVTSDVHMQPKIIAVKVITQMSYHLFTGKTT